MLDRVYLKVAILERQRLRMALTQTEFARKLKISATTRTKMFAGGPVAMRTARRIARFLGMCPGGVIDARRRSDRGSGGVVKGSIIMPAATDSAERSTAAAATV